MERLAQFRNRFVLLLFAVIFLLLYIETRTGKTDLKINLKDASLKQWRGILYYRGKPFTGQAFALYPNGDTAKLAAYDDGKQDGAMLSKYPNGQIAEQRYFINGKKEGVHKGWWENGRQKFEYHFVNDEYEGAVTEWGQNGGLFRQFHYENGHESGSQKMWWDDGTIRANYVIINGQKFGLFGQKLCTNTLSNAGLK